MDKPSESPKPKIAPPDRKPWPMWPIMVSILSFMIFYTWFQLTFRKTEQPYEPSQAMKQRVQRAAVKNFYDWYNLSVTEIPEFESTGSAAIDGIEREGPLEKELPSQIVYYLPRRPILVPQLSIVESNRGYNQKEPILISLQLPLEFAENPAFQLTALYKDNELILLAEMRLENDRTLTGMNLGGLTKNLNFSINAEPIKKDFVQVKLYSGIKTYNWQLERASIVDSQSDTTN